MVEIFVFGSNLAGRHGAEAALAAVREHGAIYGQGEGMQGNSYGIPTKDRQLRSLGLDAISSHVMRFLRFAANRRDLTFRLTPIGCGLAGYKPEQIAPMFRSASPNVLMPPAFADALAGSKPTKEE